MSCGILQNINSNANECRERGQNLFMDNNYNCKSRINTNEYKERNENRDLSANAYYFGFGTRNDGYYGGQKNEIRDRNSEVKKNLIQNETSSNDFNYNFNQYLNEKKNINRMKWERSREKERENDLRQ